MGLAVMMGVQTPAMAAETSQESMTQETVLEPQTEESETAQVENAESPAEEIETTQVENAESLAENIETTQVEITESQTAESQIAEAETEQATTTEYQAEEVNATETQTEETAISTENAESQVEEASEQVGQTEQETEAEVEAEIAVLAAEEDGWHQNDDGSRYYVKDGEILKGCVEKIDDSYYGFDWKGVMYTDSEFDIWNEETQKREYYRAKADGSLYVNEWYKTKWETSYYYGEGGKAYSGIQTVDGNQYYFENTGYLCQNTTVTTEDGRTYACDEKGIVTELINNDWTEINGKRYYVKDGEVLKGCVEKIGDFYYGFNWNGVMYADCDFGILNQETQKRDYYRAKADGSLYVNEWYSYYSWSKYYYGSDGKAYSGIQIVEGKQHYFDDNGKLCTNYVVATEDGKYYHCDEEGIATELELANNDWTEINGKRYYVKDGELLKNCVEKIGDFYYGFDYNAVLYVNSEFGTWNQETQKQNYYRAKTDGSLYVNEWYTYSEWNKYYYGEEGRAYSGFHTIDGKQYYFKESGQMYTNTIVADGDGKYYFCGEDGVATERTLANNAWTEVAGKYYYMKDGELLKDCIEKIGDVYYGFNSDGVMYADSAFYIRNQETYQMEYYRAKADGSFYVNEWYIPNNSNNNPYYYGEGGIAYSGFKEVDGILYYFNYDGERYQNKTVAVDGKNYYCDAEGAVTEISEGWNQIDGKRVYIKDGAIVKDRVIKIGDNYYGFNYDGFLYVDTTFSARDAEGNNDVYLAKADGSLYVNEWHGQLYTSGFRKRYYGEDGKLVYGLKIIDGKQYYFDMSGLLVVHFAYSVDGKNYYSFGDGTVIELSNDGWNKVGEEYLYIKDGQLLTSCVAQIDGAYYGFDNRGFMYSNTTFSIWSENYSKQDYYWASPSGALYTNTWGGDTYANYYGADAKRCKGAQTIDGVQYGFDNSGYLVVSDVFISDGVNYYCDAEGRMTEMPNNQWYKGDNGKWYYVQDGTLLKNCTAQIGETWYQFDSWGRMLTSGLNANADGSLRVNTWGYDGTYWHYYGADGQMYQSGLYEIAGVKYYFTDGNMVTSDIVKVNNQIYVADANGYLTSAPKTGWILAGSDYYYVKNGTLLSGYPAIEKINGAYYAFDYNGKMYANGEYQGYRSATCRARADGSLYVSQWYQAVNGNWYYYGEDANRVTGMVKINGVSYLFNPDGILKINGVVQSSGKYYLADENGICVQTPGWVLKGGIWYYVQSDGSLYQGILKAGGYTYYMNPRMVTNSEWEVIDGIPYTIDASGHVSMVRDGFYNNGLLNNLYYIADGKSAEEGWKQINGSTYYFQKDVLEDAHWALSGGIYRIENKYYRFNSDGTLAVDGWYLDSDGKWYYSYETGELATGDVSLNGTVYHFADDGELKTGILVENGTCSLYSDDGTLLETGSSQGWNLLGGNYYYLKGNSLLTNGSYKLADGKWYSFDEDGRMQANLQDSVRWYGESGAAQTGWLKVGETLYYASEVDGMLYKGLHVINGVTYYFDEKGAMQTGQVVAGGNMLTFDGNGGMIATNPMPDGWTYYNNEWFYYQNGKPYTGWVGAYYIRSGNMLVDTTVDWHGKTYYLGEDGAYLTNAWYGNWYIKADGTKAQSEWLEIDGKMYRFNSLGRRVKFIDDEVTEENGVYTEDGVYLPANDYAQGWVLIDGTYYYKEGENFVVNQTRKINGDWYLFDVHGRMVTGFSIPEKMVLTWSSYEYDEGKFYYGQDGRRCYYVGWQVIDGKWYYFDAASEAASGWQIINGVRYYFDTESHAMVTGYRVISNTLYYFDANGVCQGVSGPQDGWYQADGNWYYIQGGRVVKGSAVINNAWYEFDEDGVWISE